MGSTSDNDRRVENVENSQEEQMGDALMEMILEFQAVTGMEDMEESRPILERSNMDLLKAISSQMGWESGSQQFHSNDAQAPSTSRQASSNHIAHLNRMSVPRGSERGRGGILGFIWKLITAPVDMFFRYFWDFCSTSDNDRRVENVENSQEEQMGDALMEMILEFQAVTGMEDMEESRLILERSNMDLLKAISSQMGWESGSQQFHSNDAQTPSTSRQASSNHIAHLNRMSVPRGSERGRGGILGFIWKLITAPVDMFFRYFWDFLGFGLRFIRSDPRQAITDPVQDVIDFIQNYERRYGTAHPTFYQGTYSQAINDAKKELKFLMVYLHCNDHVDTDIFCENVMPNTSFRDLIRENMLFWSCSVSLPEGYRTSQALRENTIEGETEPDVVLSRLHQAVADNEAFLVAERQERLERSMTQMLRQQQDAAYLESLKADQEKERRKKEELEKKRQEELEKLRLVEEERLHRESLKQQKQDAARNLKPEPSSSDQNVVRVVIKLPSGTRLERRFLKSDSLKHLYLFVFGHQEAPDFFEIATNFPKRTLPCKPTPDNPEPCSFIDAGLGRNEMLFLYDLES